MHRKESLLVTAGVGCWVLFGVAIASSGFGILETIIGTHLSNWLLLLSISLAIFSTGLLVTKLRELNALSLPIISGVLGMTLLCTVVALALLKAARYA